MNIGDTKFLLDVIDKFGVKNQMLKAIEEMSELTQALIKHINSETNNVEEEIADVLIVVEQLRLIYNNNNIEKFIDYKIKRLKEKMKE